MVKNPNDEARPPQGDEAHADADEATAAVSSGVSGNTALMDPPSSDDSADDDEAVAVVAVVPTAATIEPDPLERLDQLVVARSGGNDEQPTRAPKRPFKKRHPRLSIALVVMAVLGAYPSFTYVQALRKPGQESFQARTAQWGRDMRLGGVIDWLEQKKYATDEYGDTVGAAPDASAFAPAATASTMPASTTSTKAPIPHTKPPTRMASPVQPPADGEGQWTPAGPLVNGLPAVYTTKVRPDATHTGLTIFAAWIDPKLASVRLIPGSDLPGGTWSVPNHIPAEQCSKAIMASNGGFRLEQSAGGYYAEGREAHPLRDGAASLVLRKDGTVDIGQWGRDIGVDQLPLVESVRQNLKLLVDGGQPVANLESLNWGAELPNSYFVWRSAYGVTADGALVYVGGPALQPRDLAQHLANAGAVRGMQGDINPEWVAAIMYSTNPDGTCKGTKGLTGPYSEGGMMGSDNRYLNTDTRDFIAVFAK